MFPNDGIVGTWHTKVLAVWSLSRKTSISFVIFGSLLCSTAAGERQERQHEQRLQEAEQQLRAQGQVYKPLQQDTLILIGLKSEMSNYSLQCLYYLPSGSVGTRGSTSTPTRGKPGRNDHHLESINSI